jgi:hypothetical protein
MRLVGIVVAIVVGLVAAAPEAASETPAKPAGTKAAGTKAKKPLTLEQQLKPYVGRVVYSPDAPPTTADELPRYLAANAVAENAYDLIKPPWRMHLVAVLAKDPGKKPVQLVFADKADKKLATMHAVDVKPQKKLVMATTEATIAAGFEAHKTYVVRLIQGKTVLAKAEISLKD